MELCGLGRNPSSSLVSTFGDALVVVATAAHDAAAADEVAVVDGIVAIDGIVSMDGVLVQ